MTERIVIVGAGPAGIRATEILTNAGLRPVVIDEGAAAGGQIYRRPPQGFTRPPEALYGTDAPKARALHALFDAMVARGAVEHLPQSSVLSVAEDRLQVLTPDGLREIDFDKLLLATGATDRLMPIPGWQSAGVYSLGATQIALKAQGVAFGQKIVLAGSGPLLTLVAVQLLKAGANVAAVLDTSSLGTQMRGLPTMLVRPVLALRGMSMRARLARIYHAGVRLARIETDANGPVAVHWTKGGGTRRTDCDTVGMGWHLRAETQLAGLAGAPFEHNATWAQWLPRSDRMGRAGERLYLAGDGLRILGADGAEVMGRLAATACLVDMGLPAPDAATDLRRLTRLERFAEGVARAFPWPTSTLRQVPGDTVVCRCEGITAAALRDAVDHGGAEANRVKSLARVGMGRCQGRFCQLAGAELIAARAGRPVADVGRLRDQAPVRPAPVGAMIGK
jgi:NADPH-dependent 2,4-dienoyl-CoA reductase/sulfur reductase-like enzyme